MRVVINGQEQELPAETTVAELVARYNLRPEHVAVEVNCNLVTRRLFDSTALSDGDRVEIVTLVGGG